MGSYKDKETMPNAWGFHDMHGNVFEWCADALDPNNVDYGPGMAIDPLGMQGTFQVYRGGGWFISASLLPLGFSPRVPTIQPLAFGFPPRSRPLQTDRRGSARE